MNNVIIDIWESYTSDADQVTVLPDGCRDVIFRVSPDESRQCYISPYFSSAKTIPLLAGSYYRGFRLSPGVVVDEQGFLSNLLHLEVDEFDIMDMINEYSSLSKNAHDTLKCIENNSFSVSQLANNLGVHARTLQRLMLKETGLSPSYWLRLSRIRQAGRYIALGYPLAEAAALIGYSDQSHMTRECVHWFGVTPTILMQRPDLFKQLENPAFS